MIRYALIALFVVGCASTLPAVQRCDAEAAARAMHEGVAACQSQGFSWQECPERDAILAALEADFEACSNE